MMKDTKMGRLFAAMILFILLIPGCEGDKDPTGSNGIEPPDIEVAFSAWERTNGPFSGYIQACLVTGQDDLFISGFRDGVYTSTDNGDQWIEVAGVLEDVIAGDFAMSANGYLWAIASWESSEAGVYRSTDHGATWTLTNLSWVSGPALAVDSTDHIYAVHGNAIWESGDYGDGWTEITDGSLPSEIGDLAATGDGTVFAVTLDDGIFRSLDGGATWEPINQGLPAVRVHTLAINQEGTIFAGTNGEGIYRSQNQGDYWAEVNRGLTNHEGVTISIDASGQLFVGAYGMVFRSPNNGAYWERIDPGFGETAVHTIALNSSHHLFAGTNYHGIFRSTDEGISWQQINTGILNSTVNALATGTHHSLYAGTTDGVFRSIDGGDEWLREHIPYPAAYQTEPFVLDIVTNPSTGSVLVATRRGVYRADEGGGTWSRVSTHMFDALAINSKSQVFGGSPGLGVFRSVDNGDTWVERNTGLSNTVVSVLGISDSDDLFATTQGGLFMSSDNGNHWRHTGLGADIQDIVVNARGEIFAASADGVINYSKDNGESWEPRTSGLPEGYYFTALQIDRSGVLYVGSLRGVFASGDNGKSWQPAGTELEDVRIYSLVLDQEDHLCAGTDGKGVFRSRVSRVE